MEPALAPGQCSTGTADHVCTGTNSYIEGSDLPALVVVTIRDVASGKKVGIGFSQGSETAAAYRMAQFCAAIGLEAFGALLGLKIKDRAKGVSPHMVTDRGPVSYTHLTLPTKA